MGFASLEVKACVHSCPFRWSRRLGQVVSADADTRTLQGPPSLARLPEISARGHGRQAR